MLDYDLSYLGLADDTETRIDRYKAYLKQGASDNELQLLSTAWARNQLTGNKRFVDEIEQRIGFRITHRGRGNPRD